MRMIAEVDKDGSGAIDFDEFKHMMTAKIGERDSKEELMKAFQIIDQDKNVHIVTLLIVFIVCVYIFSNYWCLSITDLVKHGIGENICCRHSAYLQGFGRKFY